MGAPKRPKAPKKVVISRSRDTSRDWGVVASVRWLFRGRTGDSLLVTRWPNFPPGLVTLLRTESSHRRRRLSLAVTELFGGVSVIKAATDSRDDWPPFSGRSRDSTAGAACKPIRLAGTRTDEASLN